jgi:hypothetical protein
MQRPETEIEREVKILCNKPNQQINSMKTQCIGLNGGFCGYL